MRLVQLARRVVSRWAVMAEESQPKRDRINGRINGGFITFESLRIAAAVLAGVAGALGLQSVNPPRPDPFTGQDAKVLSQEIRLDIRDLCQRVPPQPLRERIIAIEQVLAKLHPTFQPGTFEWGWADCERYR